MAWVVDTCLLLDIGLDDPKFAQGSAALLDAKRAAGLVVCPVTFAALSPAFAGDTTELEKFLAGLQVDITESWLVSDTLASAAMWSNYVHQRKLRTIDKRPIADVLIGAFAARFDGLLTRNPADFRDLRPAIKVITP